LYGGVLVAVVRCAIAYNARLIIPIRLIVLVRWWCGGGAVVVVYFITGKKKPLSRGVF
jgi:hypothetical protein